MMNFELESMPEITDAEMLDGLNAFAKAVHENADDHGWWEDERRLPEILMLCVSELSEALEEYREGRPDIYCKHYEKENCDRCMELRDDCAFKEYKPEGVAIELADCIIRILDYCGRQQIDIEKALLIKHGYNKTREYRHGGKRC